MRSKLESAMIGVVIVLTNISDALRALYFESIVNDSRHSRYVACSMWILDLRQAIALLSDLGAE